MRGRILLIDDDPGLSEVIGMLLEREGYAFERAGTVKEGLARIKASELDLVVTDLKLPDGTGLDVIRASRARHPELPLIMITSYSSMESAIGALRAGAVDYIIKPFDNHEFLHAIERTLNERRTARENALHRRSLRKAYEARPIVGESPGMRRVAELVRKAAAADANVLVTGESGTGKELVTLTLHFSSPRAERAFVALDCSVTPREALAEELRACIAAGSGGTLFLDEVTELPAALQLELLHLLEEKAMRGLDLRLVAAAHRDLAALIERGQFRKDLYYRLSVISIALPALRERGADVLLLARHFAEHYARKLGKRIEGFDAEFSAFLRNHPWPGNVRELENMIERSVIFSEATLLTGRDLAE
ncbi:MAG: sigma-54-dependent transcriptional regulator, partial [Burkholderiales bacterium]